MGERPRRSGAPTAVALAALAVLAAGCPQPSPPVRPADPSEPLTTGSYKFVALDGEIRIHDMADGHRHVRTLRLPAMAKPRGIAAHAGTARLYVPYWGANGRLRERRERGFSYLTCVDLRTERVVWTRTYAPSIDSLAVTPDGRRLFLPSGEDTSDGFWFVLDAETGDEIARIPTGPGPHNTVMGPGGRRVYLASLAQNELMIADTRTLEIVRRVGPFGERIRPFAVNADETLAFVNVNFLSGFEVADLSLGRVLHRVEVAGHPWVDPKLPFTQSHGVALTPDEREVWVVDAYNRLAHVFDTRGLPERPPRQVASVDVANPAHPRSRPKWINMSRDGRFVHVSTGAIVSTGSRSVEAWVAPSRYFLQIDYEDGEPVRAYSRYGLGHASALR